MLNDVTQPFLGLTSFQAACADQRVQHRRRSATAVGTRGRASFSGLRPLPVRRSLRCCCRSTQRLLQYTFRPSHCFSRYANAFAVSERRDSVLHLTRTQLYSDCISSGQLSWPSLPPDAVLLTSPDFCLYGIQFTEYAAGLPLCRWALFCTHIVDLLGHQPYTRLPFIRRIRITPGNHRKHRPEAHRCNRPGDSVDARLSGLRTGTRTRSCRGHS